MTLKSSPLLAALLFLPLLVGCLERESDGRPGTVSTQAANQVSARPVILYFEGPSGRLAPERRELPLPRSDAASVRPLLDALLEGSANSSVPRLFPDETVIRGAFLLPEGTAVVDLGGKTIQEGWNAGSREEMLAAYAIVQTLVANFSQVRQVHILVGGEVVPTLAGHLDLTHPLRPLAYLVDERELPVPSPAG